MLPNEYYHNHDYENFDKEDQGPIEEKFWAFKRQCVKYMYKEVRKRQGVVITPTRIYAICPEDKSLGIASVVADKGYIRFEYDMSPYEIIKLAVSLEQYLKKSSDSKIFSKYFESHY